MFQAKIVFVLFVLKTSCQTDVICFQTRFSISETKNCFQNMLPNRLEISYSKQKNNQQTVAATREEMNGTAPK
jgi:hypothetical protein